MHYDIVVNPASDFAYLQIASVTINSASRLSGAMTPVVYSFTTEWDPAMERKGFGRFELYEPGKYDRQVIVLQEDWVRQGIERFSPELELWYGRYQRLPFLENVALRLKAGATDALGKEVLENGFLSLKIETGAWTVIHGGTVVDLGPMFSHTKRSLFFKLLVFEGAATKKYFVLRLEIIPRAAFLYGTFRYDRAIYQDGTPALGINPQEFIYRAYVLDAAMWEKYEALGFTPSPFLRGEDKKW
jgi:hypothetical protein